MENDSNLLCLLQEADPVISFYDVKDREHPFLILNVLISLLFNSTVQMLET